MTTPPTPKLPRFTTEFCANCGTPLTGPYCSHCGVEAGADRCDACGIASRRGGSFCPSCGAAMKRASPPPARTGRVAPWVLGAVLAISLIAAIVTPSRRPVQRGGLAPPPRAASPADDLERLPPAARFDALYRRVIAAAQAGDQGTVASLAPAALAAFAALDSVTPDARYHLAMLRLHLGEPAAARAQADSIRRREPGHLFVEVIAAAAARWTGDSAAVRAAHQRFLTRYQAEVGSQRPEYAEHRAMLEEVRRAAAGSAAIR